MREGQAERMDLMWRAASIALFMLVGLVSQAAATEGEAVSPIVRAQVIPRSAVVGSPMQLQITVLVPTWFKSAPKYPSFEVAGLIVRRPPDSSHNVRETIDGVAYAGIVREYQIYPQRAATYLLDDLVVNVVYADPDTRDPVAVALKLHPLRFSATIPAPASELDPFLATSRLVMEQEVEGAVDELEVGDAITRTITVRVRDLPAMFIPPLFPDGEDLSGLRAYPQSPQSEDLAGHEAGRTTGSRIESVTYVIEEPGEYALPVLSLRWWNRRTGTIEITEAPAISFQVPVPAAATGADDVGSTRPTAGFGDRLIRFVIGVSVLLGLMVLLTKLLGERVRGLVLEWDERRRRRANSEPVRFRKLRRLLRRGKPHDIYGGLAMWLRSIGGTSVTLASLSGRPGCEMLAESVAALGGGLYADEAGREPGLSRDARASLRRGLDEARDSILGMKGIRSAATALPPLNPRSNPTRSISPI
jgi:hypothetical protein